MRWPRGVRARLAGALVLLVAVTAIALGVTTTVFVEARLRQQALADAAVAAGPVGREAAAETDATLRAEMLSYSRAKGVFAGLSIQGSSFRDDGGENKELYGKEIDNKTIVTGSVPPPKGAAGLMSALSKF